MGGDLLKFRKQRINFEDSVPYNYYMYLTYKSFVESWWNRFKAIQTLKKKKKKKIGDTIQQTGARPRELSLRTAIQCKL